MESENIYHNAEHKNDSGVFNKDLGRDDISTDKETPDNQKRWRNFKQNEAVHSRRSRYFLLIKAFLGLICVLLVVAIMMQHNKLSTERDLMKMSYMNIEYSEALNSLKVNYSRLTDDREELEKNLSYTIQKNLQLEAKLKLWSSQRGWYFISSEQKTWSDSRQFCRDRGGDLIIINTEEEQMLVSSIIKGNTWIGLSYIENEGVLKWVDGTPLNIGFWIQGEPNNLGRGENCIHLWSSQQAPNNWNDANCLIQMRFICEN